MTKCNYDRAEEALKEFVGIVGEQTTVVIYLPPLAFERLRHPGALHRIIHYDTRGVSKSAVIIDNVMIMGDQRLAHASPWQLIPREDDPNA